MTPESRSLMGRKFRKKITLTQVDKTSTSKAILRRELLVVYATQLLLKKYSML